MVLINYAGREINAKIVYYGPGLSGKTTNLECIYASVPSNSRGKMVSMKTRQDRTLFFDFLPLELGEVHGFRTRFLLYTVPGQVFYNATRKLVLKGADAVVFVADSQHGKTEDNLESLRNLEENLRENNLSLDSIPWVIQYNKRDLPNVHSVEELEKALNPQGVPYFEAAAAAGRGVYETLHAVSRALFQRLVAELRPGAGRPAAQPTARPGVEAPTAPATPASAAASGPAGSSLPPTMTPPAPMRTPAPASTQSPAIHAQQSANTQVSTLEQERQTGAVPRRATRDVVPQFGTPAGNTPLEPTPADILDSVQATSQIAQPDGLSRPVHPKPRRASREDFDLGHIVDLSAGLEQAGDDQADGVFIKDPLRGPQPQVESASGGGRVVPARTIQVPVVLSKDDVRPGTVIRIALDVRIES